MAVIIYWLVKTTCERSLNIMFDQLVSILLVHLLVKPNPSVITEEDWRLAAQLFFGLLLAEHIRTIKDWRPLLLLAAAAMFISHDTNNRVVRKHPQTNPKQHVEPMPQPSPQSIRTIKPFSE
jgi:hypothetical protein